jgi:hypothetical protein
MSPNSNSSNEGNATVHSFVGSDLGFDNDGIFTFEYSFSKYSRGNQCLRRVKLC